MECAGRIALIEHVAPKRSSSFAAAWGTAAHEVAEWCFKNNGEPESFPFSALDIDGFKIPIDDEVRETAGEFVSYVRQRLREYRDEIKCGEDGEASPSFFSERKYYGGKLGLPLPVAGTADGTLVFPAWELVEVIDLKGGEGVVVEAAGNRQARTYGTLAKSDGVAPAHYSLQNTIVQPRAPHTEGSVRSERLTADEQNAWAREFKAAVVRAKRALDEFDPTSAEWAQRHLKAGKHCKFCPVAGVCRAQADKALAIAQTRFEDLDRPASLPSPAALSPAEIGYVLSNEALLTQFLKDCKARAAELINKGERVASPDGEFKLFPKKGNRTWIGGKENIPALLAMETGLPRDAFLSAPAPLTPAAVEKTLKRKKIAADIVSAYIDRPVTGKELALVVNRAEEPAKATIELFADLG